MTTHVSRTATLADLSEAIFVGFSPSRAAKDDESGIPLPFIHIKDVVDDHLPSLTSLDKINFPLTANNGRLKLRRGDVLVSAKGTLSKCALVTAEHEDAIPSVNFAVIRPKPEVRSELIWAYFRTPEIQAIMARRAKGTLQMSLGLGDFQKLKMRVPPLDIQNDIADLILLSEQYYKKTKVVAALRREESFDVLMRICGTDQ